MKRKNANHPWKRIKHPVNYRRWRDRHGAEHRKLRMRFLAENGVPGAD